MKKAVPLPILIKMTFSKKFIFLAENKEERIQLQRERHEN